MDATTTLSAAVRAAQLYACAVWNADEANAARHRKDDRSARRHAEQADRLFMQSYLTGKWGR